MDAAGSSVSGEVAMAVSSDSDEKIEQPTKKELALWPGQKLVRAQHGGFFPKRQALGNCVNHKTFNFTSICIQQRMQRGRSEQGGQIWQACVDAPLAQNH